MVNGFHPSIAMWGSATVICYSSNVEVRSNENNQLNAVSTTNQSTRPHYDKKGEYEMFFWLRESWAQRDFHWIRHQASQPSFDCLTQGRGQLLSFVRRRLGVFLTTVRSLVAWSKLLNTEVIASRLESPLMSSAAQESVELVIHRPKAHATTWYSRKGCDIVGRKKCRRRCAGAPQRTSHKGRKP